MIYSQEEKDNILIEATRSCDIKGMGLALRMGADPNCKIVTKNDTLNLIDFCSHFKGKRGKTALKLLTMFGAVHEKKYPQKKPRYVAWSKKKPSQKKDYNIRMRQKRKEERIIERLTPQREIFQ